MKSSKSDFRQGSQQLLPEKLRSNFHETKTFRSLPEVANLCISRQAALRISTSRLYGFPVLMAGSCYASSFASESALYRL